MNKIITQFINITPTNTENDKVTIIKKTNIFLLYFY